MGNCRDCRWWAQSLGPEVDQWGHWSNILGGDGYCLMTLSGSATCRESVPNEPNVTKAWANDDEGHLACLVTSPDFGCVQFEARAAAGRVGDH